MLRPGWIAGPGIETLKEKPRLQKRLVDERLRVHVWVVNTEDDLQVCLDMGAEAVVTDRPDLIRSWVDGD